MEPADQICKVLEEIRDLLKSREQKYDTYLTQSREIYADQLRRYRKNAYLLFVWMFVVVFVAAYAGITFFHK